MTKSILFFIIASAFSVHTFAQATGAWDNTRATTKEIKVGAGNRIVIKTEDFPLGTTELAFRITLLDDNQQMASSLVSLLKAIPDPTGISQGSAGAVFLLSKVSGDDKCTYAVFSSQAEAAKYQDKGDVSKACLVQGEKVSKDARLISQDKVACFKGNALWFGFESQNWVMKEKIVLEVVPWVDTKLSRGWSNDHRKEIMALCKTSGLADLMLNPDDLCLCILDKFRDNYTWKEYSDMLAAEKSKAFRDFGNACLESKTADKTLLNTVRNDAYKHFQKGNYGKAIELLNNAIIGRGNATAKDYYALGTYYLFSKQNTKAEDAFHKGEKLDGAELLLKLGLAHAALLNGDTSEAKSLYKKYKDQNVTASKSWNEQVKADFDSFKKAGIDSEDFERILKLLQ